MRENLNQYIEKALYNYDLPGLGIGVYCGKEDTFYENAVGVKDFITKEPLKINHIFHMASVSKLITGTAILQLYIQGALDLDENLTTYLKWFEMADERYKEITIRHLLSHTSGMPDVEDYCWDKPETDEGALERYVRSDEVKKARLLWSPSENKFAYSNMAYEILGTIIATVSGMSYEEYVKRNIFSPLSMNDSEMLTFERDMSCVCTPHGKNLEKHIVKEKCFPYNRAHGPSSTLTSTLGDLKKFAQGVFSVYYDRDVESSYIISGSVLDEAWEEVALIPNNGEHIGLSWFKREQCIIDSTGEEKCYTLYGHEGTDTGFRASFWICPQLEISIAVVSNISHAPVKKISKQVFELLFA